MLNELLYCTDELLLAGTNTGLIYMIDWYETEEIENPPWIIIKLLVGSIFTNGIITSQNKLVKNCFKIF